MRGDVRRDLDCIRALPRELHARGARDGEAPARPLVARDLEGELVDPARHGEPTSLALARLVDRSNRKHLVGPRVGGMREAIIAAAGLPPVSPLGDGGRIRHRMQIRRPNRRLGEAVRQRQRAPTVRNRARADHDAALHLVRQHRRQLHRVVRHPWPTAFRGSGPTAGRQRQRERDQDPSTHHRQDNSGAEALQVGAASAPARAPGPRPRAEIGSSASGVGREAAHRAVTASAHLAVRAPWR